MSHGLCSSEGGQGEVDNRSAHERSQSAVRIVVVATVDFGRRSARCRA